MRTAGRSAAAGAALAAVALTAGCVVGPTIEDERPAAAAAPTGRGMGAEPPSGGNGGTGNGGTVGTPGDAGPGAEPTPAGPVRLTVGGPDAYVMDGARLRVVKVVTEGAPAGGRILVAVHLEVRAGGTAFKTRSADVDLLACPELAGAACSPPLNGPDRRGEPDHVAAGTTATTVRLFLAAPDAATRSVVRVAPHGRVGAEFAPDQAPASASAAPASAQPSASVSAAPPAPAGPAGARPATAG